MSTLGQYPAVRDDLPEVDHIRVYTPAEKLDLALSHYHAELQQYISKNNTLRPVRPVRLTPGTSEC